MKKMRGMVALCVALSVTAGSSALLAQKVDNKQEVKRSKAEQLDIEVLLKAVDTVSSGQAAPTTMVTWESNHFIRSQDGTTYVPFTVQLDRSKLTSPNVALYVRVDNKGATAAPPSKDNKDKDKAATIHPWENVYFATVGPEGKVSRAFQVKGGADYDVYIAVKDKGTVEKADKNFNPTVAVAKKELSIPDYNKPELTTSSVILATAIQPLPAGASAQEDPYVFGPMQIIPSRDGKYKKADTLEVIYWIYGITGDSAGKPDVQIENSFNQKTAEGEKFFNKTQPQTVNAQSLPPDFTATSGPIPGTLQVPLLSFPPGDYRLEIKITDKPSGKTVTQNVNFSVAAS
jgi:hypothetical protein